MDELDADIKELEAELFDPEADPDESALPDEAYAEAQVESFTLDAEELEQQLLSDNEDIQRAIDMLGLTVKSKKTIPKIKAPYATAMDFRGYQVMLAAQGALQDALIVLPTGLGKSVIAEHIHQYFLRLVPELGDKKILITAPSNVLIKQHYDGFQEHMPDIAMARIKSSHGRKRRLELWESSQVIFMTNELAISGKTDLNLEEVGLVIVDEIHKARKEAAMAKLVRRVRRQGALARPRFVGLTATLDLPEHIPDFLVTVDIQESQVFVAPDTDPWIRPYVYQRMVKPHQIAWREEKELIRQMKNWMRLLPVEVRRMSPLPEIFRGLTDLIRTRDPHEWSRLEWAVQDVMARADRSEEKSKHFEEEKRLMQAALDALEIFIFWNELNTDQRRERIKNVYDAIKEEKMIHKGKKGLAVAVRDFWGQLATLDLMAVFERIRGETDHRVRAWFESEEPQVSIPATMTREIAEERLLPVIRGRMAQARQDQDWEEVKGMAVQIKRIYHLQFLDYFETVLGRYGPMHLLEVLVEMGKESTQKTWKDVTRPALLRVKVDSYLKWLRKLNIRHPKVRKLKQLLARSMVEEDRKTVIFTEDRRAAQELAEVIEQEFGFKTGLLVGRSKGKKGKRIGMKSKEQEEMLARFKAG